MSKPVFDLCAVGNALVDIIVSTDDTFLQANGITKGAMNLVDDATSTALYEKAGAAVEMSSGGSAANTLAGFASLGGVCAYMGKVGRDQFGQAFTHDLKAQNIHYVTPPSPDLSTGRCLVLVTPDAQRSMNTYLGAAVEFGVGDVQAELVEQSAITYLEGYLFDKDAAKQAFRKIAKRAHTSAHKLSLTLSDVFCVARHRAEFLDLIAGDVDILFANENEVKTLYETDDLDVAASKLRAHVEIAVVTRGAQDTLIISGDQTYNVLVHPVSSVIDTTGAGDLYAAGFLFGLTRNLSLLECGHIGAIAAAEVISHYGPRPQKKLSALIG